MHFVDSVTNTMSSVITIMKGIPVPSFAWKKMFFPAEGPLEDRGNIFHGRLYRCIKRKLWSGRKDDPEVRIELNVEPLKWYKLKSCGNK